MNKKYGGEKQSAKNKTKKSVKKAPVKKQSRKTINIKPKELTIIEKKDKIVVIDKKKRIETWEEYAKSHKINKVSSIKAGDAFEMFFGFHPNVNIYNVNQNEENIELMAIKNARKWWEQSGTTTQCGNSIGNYIKGTTKCYICGFGINTKDVSPQCEHILPVFKAALYLTLYRDEYKDIITRGKKDILSLTAEEKRIYNEVNMEYDWAHKCCNLKKLDIDFIKFNDKKKEFELDYNNSKLIFKKIIIGLQNKDDDEDDDDYDDEDDESKNKKTHCNEDITLKEGLLKLSGNNLNMENTAIKKWIEERIDILQQPTGKVGKIIHYLNGINDDLNKKNHDFKYSLFTLVSLCNAISAADIDKVDIVWRRIDKLPPLKKLPPIEQLTKAIVNIEITNLFVELCRFDWNRIKVEEINNFYKEILNIPDNINIKRRDLKKIEKNDLNDLSKAILFSLLIENKNNSKINRFYRNLYSIICYKNVNTYNVLFPGDNGKKYASNIVGQSLKILYILKTINNIKKNKIIKYDKNEKENIILLQFLNTFELE